MTEASILCITASQGYKMFMISSKHTVLILHLLTTHLLSVYPMMQCYASYYGQSLENSRNLASEILLIYMPVLSICIVGLLMSRSAEWTGLVGTIIFFTKKEHLPTLVCYNFFVLHTMVTSPPLCLLLLLFKRNA